MTDYPDLEATIDIDAPPARVWALVSDLPRMSGWSDQVVRTKVLGRPRVGARFVNLNRQGPKFWPTTGKIVRFTPDQEIAFRITENRTVWSFRLVPRDGGTHVVHKREAPDGVSRLSTSLTKAVLGGVPRFTEELRSGMNGTLAKLKAEVE